MTEMTQDRQWEARRDGCVRRGEMADPRLSFVRRAEECLGAGENTVGMAAACERLCYALEAFEDEAGALGYGASMVSMVIVKYFGPDYTGDCFVRDIAAAARNRGYAGNVFVSEEDGQRDPDKEEA